MQMADADRDPARDALLDLDGQVFFVDDKAKHWVKFEVKRVAPSIARPHGLRYSLTLHDAAGQQLVGFDNAHPAQATPGGRLTTSTGFGRSGLTTMRAPGNCWWISGRPSTRC